jgi:signal transduction histidine kinase
VLFRSAANEELRLANRQRSELVKLAAEGLKDPLQSILGNAELILRRPGDGERVRQQAEVIRGSSERMLELIDELLETSKLDRGKIQMQSRSVDLAALARQVAKRFQDKAQAGRRIELSSEGSCLVQADEIRLQEIVENLVGHAASYSPAGQPVRVHVGVNGPWVRLEVRDEGPGMSPEEQERIFAKFRRRSARPTGGETASGLGLYVVKKLVEMQGGGIGVQSEPGRGTTFTVIFPRAS